MDDDLCPAVSVEIGRRESSRLPGLAPAARRCRPARFELKAAAAKLVSGHRALVAADDDLHPPIAVEIRDCTAGASSAAST